MKWLSLFIMFSIVSSAIIVPEIVPYDPYAILDTSSFKGILI